MSRRGDALRYRFDALVGGLWLVMMLGACLALRVVQGVEGLSAEAIGRASVLQLILVFVGLLALLGLALLIRGLVTTPLQRMTGQIDAMQQTGRLVKLPIQGANELQLFAEHFNDLVQHIEEQKRRIREHVVELQTANTELSHLANLKDDFLSTISHQFRTPLTAVGEGLDLMRDGTMGPLTDDVQRLVTMVDENVQRLDHLIQEALDLSLIKSGHRLLDRKPGELGELLRRCQALWQATADSRSIRLLCPDLPPVYMDAEAVREVMDHLLRNALRHAPPKSEVAVEVRAGKHAVEILVRDRGPGIPTDQLQKLFQPFVHVQTPDAPGSEGSGLGLAICRQVIERHRGRIRAESAPGAGMTVTFELPIASAHFLLEEAFRSAQEDAQYEHGQFGLLVVSPVNSAASPEVMRQAEIELRRNTHRGDRFVWFDERTLVILAVTDRPGLIAMANRLKAVVDRAGLSVALRWAVYPAEGKTPEELMGAATRPSTSGASHGPAPVTMARTHG